MEQRRRPSFREKQVSPKYKFQKLQLVDSEILHALKVAPRTLYSLSNAYFEMLGRNKVSIGTIHPHLVKLEGLGLIRGRSKSIAGNRYKRTYMVTEKGRSELAGQIKIISRALQKLRTSN